jgi:hypothetical protein
VNAGLSLATTRHSNSGKVSGAIGAPPWNSDQIHNDQQPCGLSFETLGATIHGKKPKLTHSSWSFFSKNMVCAHRDSLQLTRLKAQRILLGDWTHSAEHTRKQHRVQLHQMPSRTPVRLSTRPRQVGQSNGPSPRTQTRYMDST